MIYCPTVIPVIMARPQAPRQLIQHVQRPIANQRAAPPARHDPRTGHRGPIDRSTLDTTVVARQFDYSGPWRAVRAACTGLNGDPAIERGAHSGAMQRFSHRSAVGRSRTPYFGCAGGADAPAMRRVIAGPGTHLTPTGPSPLRLFRDTLDTPLGTLTLEASECGLSSIQFPNRPKSMVGRLTSNAVIKLAQRELTAYFASQLKAFSVPLDWHGTAFQESVWQALTAIPYGETVTYADIARAIGRPQSARPTGGAVGRNPLPIIVPCHRVIGSDRTLTGFTGGLNIKVALLELEGRLIE